MKNIANLNNVKVTDLLKLKKPLTPMFLTLYYWILLVFFAFMGIATILGGFKSFSYNFSGALYDIIMGLFIIVVGIMSSRVICETIIILFKIDPKDIDIIADKVQDTEKSESNNQ
ncbi:DUF4282 domain-containing protein [uncultured Gilliamella sp.]|uniref:DUF4282 domain-containing protein n=1 Tax=uncultured Gilliamella sp. TaxID=1193505 RepID=UPI0025FAB7F8|nr:DUF4282 domain-containing protein [uncultured Gilliamella sp.]